MITLFTGAPGAGKTASLVDLLTTLPPDRPIFVDGLDGLSIPHTRVDALHWHEELPDGAILVIDEVQRVWRPRGPGSKVPPSVSELETHRHRGIDIFLTTQSPKLVDSNVRALIGRHVHIRDTGIFGRWWYEWPEVNQDLSWKTCINKRKIKLSSKAFSLYKSASIHTKPIRTVPKIAIFALIAVCLFLVLSVVAYRVFQSKSAAPASPVPVVAGDSLLVAKPSAPVPLDFRVDFIPRMANRPESAPAYDAIRTVSAVPSLRGGFCRGDYCRCVTQQGTDSGLTSQDCRAALESPAFDAFKVSEPPATTKASK